jgi:thiosulfate reductase cytochrome b subunit
LEAKQNRIRQNLLLFLSLSVSLPQFLQQFRGNNKKPARSYHQILYAKSSNAFQEKNTNKKLLLLLLLVFFLHLLLLLPATQN